jgi:glucose 1-dehydrogenase
LKPIAIVPGPSRDAGVIDLPEPPASDGSLLVRTLLIGMCATDREIAEDGYAAPPPGEQRLVL